MIVWVMKVHCANETWLDDNSKMTKVRQLTLKKDACLQHPPNNFSTECETVRHATTVCSNETKILSQKVTFKTQEVTLFVINLLFERKCLSAL